MAKGTRIRQIQVAVDPPIGTGNILVHEVLDDLWKKGWRVVASAGIVDTKPNTDKATTVKILHTLQRREKKKK